MIDYIVRIEQYQNKRFEFLTKNFQMYRLEILFTLFGTVDCQSSKF